MTYPLNLKIGIRIFVLLLGLFLLWQGEATTMWFVVGLAYLLFSIVSLFLLSRKVEAGGKARDKE
jgi:hypothetical protein